MVLFQVRVFDADRRVMFDELSLLLSKLPVRSVWVVGGDFNAEVGSRGVGEEEVLGRFSHGRRTRSGHQLMEWARGEDLRFVLSFNRQDCRDTWFHPRGGPREWERTSNRSSFDSA